MKFKLLLLLALCSATLSHAQQPDSFVPGYYIDANQNTHSGWLKLNGVYSCLQFKADPQQKPAKLSPQEVIAIVIEKDSFVVVENYQVPYGLSNTTVSNSFARVIKRGEVTLYEVASVIEHKGNENVIAGSYLLQKNNSRQVIRVPDGAGKFKKVLSDYFSESGVISQNIRTGTFTVDNLLEIVDLYNKEHRVSNIAARSMNGF